jgi:hypothetical protein
MPSKLVVTNTQEDTQLVINLNNPCVRFSTIGHATICKVGTWCNAICQLVVIATFVGKENNGETNHYWIILDTFGYIGWILEYFLITKGMENEGVEEIKSIKDGRRKI